MNKYFLLTMLLAAPAYLSANSVRVNLDVKPEHAEEVVRDARKDSRITRAEAVARCAACGEELNADDDDEKAENRKCSSCGKCCCPKCSTCSSCSSCCK